MTPEILSVFPKSIQAGGSVNPGLLCIVSAQASLRGNCCLSRKPPSPCEDTVIGHIGTQNGWFSLKAGPLLHHDCNRYVRWLMVVLEDKINNCSSGTAEHIFYWGATGCRKQQHIGKEVAFSWEILKSRPSESHKHVIDFEGFFRINQSHKFEIHLKARYARYIIL